MGINGTTRIDETFQTLYTVRMLSRKLTIGRCIFHKEWIDGSKSCFVGGYRTSTMGLIDIDFTGSTHVKETLLGMDVTFRCHP